MARTKAVFGTCHLCGGLNKKLSFEHCPPEAAFNNTRIWQLRGIEGLINKLDLDNLRGKISQRGAGGYTLCESCNSNTGAWYVPAFVEFTFQAAGILAMTRGRASLFYPYHIYPLRVIKQILCMFFSANGPKFQSVHQDLARFVLNKEQKFIDPTYHIYAFLTDSTRSRQTGIVGTLNIESHKVRILSELTFAPLGFVLVLSSEQPDDRLVDISFFARYSYNDWTTLSLNLPSLPIYTYLPCDYRNRDEVLAQMKIQQSLAGLPAD
jgi:hypothetical protein